MNLATTAGLGAIAGFTILLGLPVARAGRPRAAVMSYLTAASVGVLLFILYDVIRSASETIETALGSDRGKGIWYAVLLAAGLGVGLLGLVGFEKVRRFRHTRTDLPVGPGAMVAAPGMTAVSAPARVREPLPAAMRLSLFIAIGIGLHNFSEGLAIGQSAAVGAFQLFYLLVIGFGLHNITEGFGISAPLAGQRPSWRFLIGLGVIGGGPTFLGTLLGHQFPSEALSVLFLALAAGAIMYVIGELQHAGRRIGSHDAGMLGLLSGFLVAYGTDALLHVAGA
ncbi:MAG: zinc permease [Chloroflexi bacterium]|nr:MAG: zinc permease [Chloroflexota bacterium]